MLEVRYNYNKAKAKKAQVIAENKAYLDRKGIASENRCPSCQASEWHNYKYEYCKLCGYNKDQKN